VLVRRTEEKVKSVVEQIRSATRNASVSGYTADLASLAQTRGLAAQVGIGRQTDGLHATDRYIDGVGQVGRLGPAGTSLQ
jgi:hypothetical protein